MVEFEKILISSNLSTIEKDINIFSKPDLESFFGLSRNLSAVLRNAKLYICLRDHREQMVLISQVLVLLKVMDTRISVPGNMNVDISTISPCFGLSEAVIMDNSAVKKLKDAINHGDDLNWVMTNDWENCLDYHKRHEIRKAKRISEEIKKVKFKNHKEIIRKFVSLSVDFSFLNNLRAYLLENLPNPDLSMPIRNELFQMSDVNPAQIVGYNVAPPLKIRPLVQLSSTASIELVLTFQGRVIKGGFEKGFLEKKINEKEKLTLFTPLWLKKQ